MKSAYKKDKDFLADVHNASESPDDFHLWWLGQSGFLIKWGNQFILLDPYLSDSLTAKYSQTEKPHVRVTEQVIDPINLSFVDLVTSSHNHTDHLDGETLNKISESADRNIKLVLPKANVEFANARLQENPNIQLVGINEHDPITIGDFRINGIAAAHNEIERDENGNPKFMGLIISFGQWSIYHSGDTLWHSELISELLKFSIDVAIVPINGNKPERKVAGNLNGAEAAAVSKAVNAKIAIPHHFDMFEFNTANPEEFTTTCNRLDQRYKVLQNGQRWSFSEIN